MDRTERKIGNGDLRVKCPWSDGFNHVCVRDVDDGDVIIINEDDLVALRDYLNEVIALDGAE